MAVVREKESTASEVKADRWLRLYRSLALQLCAALLIAVVAFAMKGIRRDPFGRDAHNVGPVVQKELPLGSPKVVVNNFVRQAFDKTTFDPSTSCLAARYTSYESDFDGRRIPSLGSVQVYFFFDTADHLSRVQYRNSASSEPLFTPHQRAELEKSDVDRVIDRALSHLPWPAGKAS